MVMGWRRGAFHFLFALMCSSAVHAQDFAPVGAKWHYGAGAAFSPNTFYMWVESVGDTLVAGRNCRMLTSNYGVDCSFYSMPYLVLWEDSAVHFYVPQLDTFQTLFDMKALPGETWQTAFTTDVSFEIDTVEVLVDSIGFQEINGHVLKQLYVTYSITSGENWGGGYMSYPAVITDRLGDMEYLFRLYTNQAICDGTYSLGLRCYEDPVLGFFSTGTAPACDYTFTSVAEEIIGQVTVYPNPTTGIIRVGVEGEREFTVHVMDCTGRNVMIQRSAGEHLVDVSELPDGVYVLRLERAGKLLGHRRIVKVE